MSTMTIMTGNIGCGKSFLASKLASRDGAVVSSMDKLYELIEGRQDSQYDAAKKAVYQATEDALIRNALAAGLDVVIDRTLMQANRRKHFIDIGKEFGAKIVSYNWGRGIAAELQRRQEKPRGVPIAKWVEIFTFMQNQYEEPDLSEGFDELLVPPPKYRFYAFDFDGTIVENARFPAWGEVISDTVEKMNALFNDLSNVIIVWSCRSNDFENEMRQFLLRQKIRFDFINDNPFYPGRRKVFAHEYYDDRNACPGIRCERETGVGVGTFDIDVILAKMDSLVSPEPVDELDELVSWMESHRETNIIHCGKQALDAKIAEIKARRKP